MKNKNHIILSAYVCIFVCIGEFVFMFLLGCFYPGYNQLKDTMSSLGASVSPVSNEISAWWILMGILFIFFATGLKKAFAEKKIYAIIASWLIALYGIGEGIGSGLFKANHVANQHTTSGSIHDILGGVGVAAILLFPLAMIKVISKTEKPFFYRMSLVIFVLGLCFVTLFLFRFSQDGKDILTVYQGLWQRLFMLNEYVYLTTIAVLMIQKKF